MSPERPQLGVGLLNLPLKAGAPCRSLQGEVTGTRLRESVYVTSGGIPLALSLLKGPPSWFDRLTTSGLFMTCNFRKQALGSLDSPIVV